MDNDYSLIMFVSVLHHIPDYMSCLKMACQRIANGGSLLTLQDPLLYSRHKTAHRVDQAACLAWRLGQGNLSRGMKTRLRRIRGILDETDPGDMVEYHVIRDGVDEEEVLSFARWNLHKLHFSRIGRISSVSGSVSVISLACAIILE